MKKAMVKRHDEESSTGIICGAFTVGLFGHHEDKLDRGGVF